MSWGIKDPVANNNQELTEVKEQVDNLHNVVQEINNKVDNLPVGGEITLPITLVKGSTLPRPIPNGVAGDTVYASIGNVGNSSQINFISKDTSWTYAVVKVQIGSPSRSLPNVVIWNAAGAMSYPQDFIFEDIYYTYTLHFVITNVDANGVHINVKGAFINKIDKSQSTILGQLFLHLLEFIPLAGGN